MDPATLATTTTTFLIPYIAKFGKNFAEDAGKKLWDIIAEKFKDKPAAKGAADEFLDKVDDPDNQEAFAFQLKRALKEDPEFVKQISSLLAQSDDTGITNTNGVVATNGSIAVEKIEISGDSKAPIIIGNQNSISETTTTSSNKSDHKNKSKE